jgi:flagellar biosynthesis protein FliQ
MKLYRLTIVAFLSFVAAFSALFLYRYHFYEDFGNGFIVGDWLINYEDGGFKRRGLSGSIMFFLQDITGVELTKLVLFFQLTSFLIFLTAFVALLWNKKIDWLYISLIISPLTFMAYLNDYGYLGRKEFLLFMLFAIYLVAYRKRNLSKSIATIFLIVISIFTLLHELFFFYISYFILADILLSRRFSLKMSALYFCSALLPIIGIILLGHNINEGESINLITDRGFQIAQHNIFIESTSMNAVSQIKEHALQYILYLVVWLFGLIHFGYFIRKRIPEFKKQLFVFLPLAITLTIPMFILAVDWGRWIQIHFVLLLLLLTTLLPSKSDQSDSVLNRQSFIGPVILIGIMCFWGMKHVYTGFYPGGMLRYFYSLAFG